MKRIIISIIFLGIMYGTFAQCPFVAPPIPEDKTWLLDEVGNIPMNFMTASTSGTGVSIKWYKEQAMTTLLTDAPFSTATYTADKTALIAELGTLYPSNIKSYWITQIDADGCESDPVEVQLLLMHCPYTAPTVIGEEKCLGELLNPVTASKPSTMAVPVDQWQWFSDLNVYNPPLYSGSSLLNHNVNNMVVGVTRFYVRYIATEPITGLQCASPLTQVEVTVNPLPTITLTAPALVCQDQGDVLISMAVNYHSNGMGSGVWDVDGGSAGINSSGIFKPDFMGQLTGTYDVGYTYTDGKGCVNNANHTINVQFTPVPTTIGHFSMVSDNAFVIVEASGLLPSATVNWYASDNTIVSNTNPFYTGDPGNIATNKTYYATQTYNGCESNKTATNVKVLLCPVPAPIVIQPSPICNYEQIPEITATIGTWLDGIRPTPTIPVVFRFYANATTQTMIAANTTGLYTPTIDTSIAATYRYYVSEYNANVSPQGCEGPRSAITVVVKKMLPPTLLGAMGVCAAPEGTNPTLLANDVLGNVEWYESQPSYPATNPISFGSSFLPSFTSVGQHTVWAVNRYNGCASRATSISFMISPMPAPPTTTPAESCINSPNVPVCATGTNIIWYQNSNRSGMLDAGLNCYTPSVTADNTYTYYATQTVNGCQSATAPVQYTIKPRPIAPVVVVSSNQMCEYEEDPIMSVLPSPGATIKWYMEDDTYLTGMDGTTYQVDRLNGRRYFATQTVNGCEGPKGMGSYTIILKPANPSLTGGSVCEGTIQDDMPVLQSNGSTDRWYSDALATNFVGTGFTYQPDATQVGSSDVTYYVYRSSNGCNSDTLPVVLHVFPSPVFSIGEDITICKSDPIATIQAGSFNPAANTNSIVAWNIKYENGALFSVEDNAVHSITPTSIINRAGTYTVYGTYRYAEGGIYCNSNMDSLIYTVNAGPRIPIVTSQVIRVGDDLPPLQAYGSPNMVWNSEQGLPIVYGQEYDFIENGITYLNNGIYTFNVYDVDLESGCRSENVAVTLTVNPPVEILENQREQIEIHPIPLTDLLHVKIPNNEPCTIIIKNIIGQIVRSSSQNQIYVADLPRGVYSVEITTKTKGITQKVILK